MFIVLRTILLTFLLYLMMGSIFFIFAGESGLELLTAFFLTFVFVAFFYGKRFALAVFKAKHIQISKYPILEQALRSTTRLKKTPRPDVYMYNSDEIDVVLVKSIFTKETWILSRGAINDLSEIETQNLIKLAIKTQDKSSVVLVRTYLCFLFFSLYKGISLPFRIFSKLFQSITRKHINLENFILALFVPVVDLLWSLIGDKNYQESINLDDQISVQKGLIIRSAESKKNASFKYDFFNLCRMFGYRRDFYSVLIN